MRKRLRGCAAIFKQDELNFLIFTRSGKIYGLNLSGCELKIIAKTCPMTQVQRVEGGYCIRVGEASENGEIESANELVFTDANFNVKFRVKLDFDFDKFELAAGGSDGWRGYFINEPNELKVLDLRSETGGFEHGGSGEFTQDEASKSKCETMDKFEQNETVRYLATKPILTHKFKQKGARILDVVTAASCRAASAKYEAKQKGAFAEQNLAPEGGVEKEEHTQLHTRTCRVLVDNAYDEDAEQILTCYEI